MSKKREPIAVTRVLVALDPSLPGRAALEAAVLLAAEMHAELQGLFVEDVNLLRLAALPFAQEVLLPSAAARRLESASVERLLKARAEELRRALVAAAERMRVKHSFAVQRGDLLRTMLAAGADVDVVILARDTPARSLSEAGLSPIARRLAESLSEAAAASEPVVAVWDGSEGSRHALDLAVRLSRRVGASLLVLVVADSKDAAELLRREVAERLHGQREAAEIQTVATQGPAEFFAELMKRPGGTVVLSRASPLIDEASLARLLDRLGRPLLLVR